LRGGCEGELVAKGLAKIDDLLVVGDQRTAQLDRAGNQQAVRRITVWQAVQRRGPASRPMAQRHRFDPGAIEKALDPLLDRAVQFDPSGVDQQRDLPDSDRTQCLSGNKLNL
jgi:hypothetical protein